jgi:poly(A) polymerase
MTAFAEGYGPPIPAACRTEAGPGDGLWAADAPVMTGDLLGSRKVLGFASAARGLPTAADDLLLLEGDGHTGPLPRPDAATASGDPSVRRVGPHPYRQLEAEHVHPADELVPGLTGAFDELVHGPDAPRYLAVLIDRLTGAGHGFWLAGGAPRDLLAGARPGEVGDLDATGTAPAGSFWDVTDQVLDEDGVSAEHPRLFNPHSLVCSVLSPQRQGHELEYRGLGVGGLPLPATGTDLRQDGRQRDLTVNTLLYDPVHHVVLDPLGTALDDLAHRGGSRCLVPAGAPDDPETCAAVLLRALKFRLRWDPADGGRGGTRGLDDTALRDWAAALPEDLAARLDERGDAAWRRTHALAATCLPAWPPPALAEVVRGYGTAATVLVNRLTGGGG